MRARRYQLTKDALAIVKRGHPWIFRDQLSSAAQVFRDGDLVKLVDGANTIVGYGTFEDEGAIAIRIVRRGPERPDAAWLSSVLDAAIARRAPLAARTTGIRLVLGESDGLPAVVIEPGRAFGTGAHPTTRLCLELLAELARGSLLDVGCGSGVLAVAGAKLGFRPVHAVDHDPVAVDATIAKTRHSTPGVGPTSITSRSGWPSRVCERGAAGTVALLSKPGAGCSIASSTSSSR